MKRITMMLALTAFLVVALSMSAVFASAKQATTFERGQTQQHAGFSENSKVKTYFSGKSSHETECR